MLKVLIAEDDFMIADMLEASLVEGGYEVCGIARTVAEAVALADAHDPDLAIIDMRLANDDLGTDISARLGVNSRLGILYATGNTTSVMLSAADGHACISKPYRFEDIRRSLEIVAELVAKGTGSPPYPRGFQLLPAKPEPSHA